MAIDKVSDAVTEAVIRGYLRAALRSIDEVMGEGFALRYPDLVGALVVAIAIDNGCTAIPAPSMMWAARSPLRRCRCREQAARVRRLDPACPRRASSRRSASASRSAQLEGPIRSVVPRELEILEVSRTSRTRPRLPRRDQCCEPGSRWRTERLKDCCRRPPRYLHGAIETAIARLSS
jgi:hypothetical protein